MAARRCLKCAVAAFLKNRKTQNKSGPLLESNGPTIPKRGAMSGIEIGPPEPKSHTY
jgi:hypothetical protein